MSPVHAPLRRNAFSLVELLLVISIIALLTGILLPALSAVRNEGKQVVCLANLRTLGQSVDMYLQHYGPAYPDVAAFPMGAIFGLDSDAAQDITRHTGCLPLSLHPILPGTPTLISESWYCPIKGAVARPAGLRRYGHGTYPFNAGALRGKNTWQVKNPPHTGLLRDFVALDKLNDDFGELRFAPPHRGAQNILYLDAHAEFDRDQRWLVWGPGEAPAFPD